MKRKITKFLAALALLVFTMPSLVAWGQSTSTVTFDASKDVTNESHSTYTTDLTTFNCYDGSTWKAIGFQEEQYTWIGPGKGGANYLETPVVNGTITSIAVTWSGNTSYYLALQTTDGTELEAKQNPSTSSTETFNVSGSYSQLRLVGRRASGTSNALAKIEKAVVTYTSGGGPSLTSTTTEIIVPQNFNNDLNNGTTGGTLTASVTYDDDGTTTNVPSATVTWTSSDPTVATIDNNGVVTLVAMGSTTIRASYAGNDQYSSSYDEIDLNVINSASSTFIFNTDAGLQALGITKPNSGAGTDLDPEENYTIGNVTMNITHGSSTNTRVWNNNGNTDLRVYNGGSLTFSVPTGYAVSRIVITGSSLTKLNADGYSNGEWTASDTPVSSVTFSATGTANILTVCVEYETNTNVVNAPTIPATTNFTESMTVEITNNATEATVYYTTDGSDPKTSATRIAYNQAFTIDNTTTVKAVAYNGTNYSVVVEATYTRVYTITINQTTGGTISANLAQAAEGETITLTATPNVGYSFSQWNITPTVTVSNNTFSMPASDVTVSASFNTATAYTISFNINGKVEMTAKVNGGNSIDLSYFVADVITEGKTFLGWYTAAIDGIKVEGEYTPTGDITLYAQFGDASSSSSGYQLVTDLTTITAGTYLFGAYSVSGGNPDPLQYRFATSSTSSGDWVCTDYVECTDGVVTSLPEGACEIVLTGDNTNGFTVGIGSSYLGYTQSSNRKLAIGNYSDYYWTFSLKSNTVNNYNVVMHKGTSYYVYDNATSTTALRGYASEQNSARGFYLFKKVEANSKEVVDATAKVTAIAANVIVTVKNDGIVYLTGNNAGNKANLIIEDGGQLISSSVAATMLKDVAPCVYSNDNRADYILIASPLGIAPTAVNNLTSGNYDLYAYYGNLAGEEWRNYKAGGFSNLGRGRGYLYANGAQTTLEFAGNINGSFSGINNLNYNESSTFGSLNLVGNPFAYETEFGVYSNDETVNANYLYLNEDGDGFLSGTINTSIALAPMQAVFVQTTAASESFKLYSDPDVIEPIETNDGLVSLSVSRNRGSIIDNAIVRFDNGSMMNKFYLNDNTTRIYIPQGNEEMAVVRSAAEAEMPVSFKASENGTYTLAVETENMEMDYLHLIDNMTGMDVDLLQTPNYTFEAKTNDYTSRFRLVFKASSTSSEADGTFAFFNGSNWTVSNLGEATLQVVDVTGRTVSSETINGNATISLNQTPGVYMLRLVNGNSVKVQKVVVR